MPKKRSRKKRSRKTKIQPKAKAEAAAAAEAHDEEEPLELEGNTEYASVRMHKHLRRYSNVQLTCNPYFYDGITFVQSWTAQLICLTTKRPQGLQLRQQQQVQGLD